MKPGAPRTTMGASALVNQVRGDRPERGALVGGDGGNATVLRDPGTLADMLAHIRSGDRKHPIVTIAAVVVGNPVDGFWYEQPVLSPVDVREFVGPAASVYVTGSRCLIPLRRELGSLAANQASLRILWPGVTDDCDPSEHPLIPGRDGELETFIEFARSFERSCPRGYTPPESIQAVRVRAESELADILAENAEIEARLRAVLHKRTATRRPQPTTLLVTHDDPASSRPVFTAHAGAMPSRAPGVLLTAARSSDLGVARPAPSTLTVRERQVLERVRAGLTNGQIAHEMGLAERTIKCHVQRILAKCGAKSRYEL
jgi:DNA-binding CsgD family transcriptional regulator